jgi:hypothetical protein
MFRDIPAPGYQIISGKKRPPDDWGDMVWCQLRNGWVANEPWPISTAIWQHTGSGADIVAVKIFDAG